MPGKDGTGPNIGGRRGGFCRRGVGNVVVNCKCPSCGNIQPHTRGIPCVSVKCSKCGAIMVRVV